MPSARNLASGWRLESLLSSAREPVVLLTSDRRIAAANSAWEQLTGFALAEVVGVECRPHGPTRAGDLAGLGGSFCPPPEALAGQPTAGRTVIIGRNGERISRQVEFWPFHDREGRLTGILGIVRSAEAQPVHAHSAQDALRHALLDLRVQMFTRHAHDTLVGQGPEHRRVLDGIDAAVGSTVPVTIIGEPGTGKRFIARLIHQQGPRRQMPLLGFDCQAIPAELLARELFGTLNLDRPPTEHSQLVAPDGATLVIGDILQTRADFQARLAATLNHGPRSARVIATTVAELDLAHEQGTIQTDLYHALTVLIIRLRPLRDRLDELPLLAQSLLERANLRGQMSRSNFSPGAIASLVAYDWPGNLRELAKVIDDAHQAAQGDSIEVTDLPATIRGERGGAYAATARVEPPTPLKDRLLAFEREQIQEALVQAHDNKTRAARRLGVNRPFLYRRLRELGLADVEADAEETKATDPDLLDGAGERPDAANSDSNLP